MNEHTNYVYIILNRFILKACVGDRVMSDLVAKIVCSNCHMVVISPKHNVYLDLKFYDIDEMINW